MLCTQILKSPIILKKHAASDFQSYPICPVYPPYPTHHLPTSIIRYRDSQEGERIGGLLSPFSQTQSKMK